MMIDQLFTCISEAARLKGRISSVYYIEVFLWIPKKDILEIDGIQVAITGLTKDNLEDYLELLSIFRPQISDYERVGSSSIFKIKMKNPDRRQIGFTISRTG